VIDRKVENVLYWAPVSDPRRIRAEPGGVFITRSSSAMMRLPFHSGGWVALFDADPSKGHELLDHIQYPEKLASPKKKDSS
jgi:hypothetical protein